MNRDLSRQLFVTVSAIFCVYGTLIGLGVLGTAVERSSKGALAANATLIAPGGPAFSIWSVIYLGLAAYTVWQWLPRARTDERARATGWLAGVSMLLNAGWLLVTQQGWIWLSVLVIFALVAVLGELVRRLSVRAAASTPERIVVDGTFGAYLGWVAVASCANVAAAGKASAWTLGELGDQLLAVVVLLVAAGLSVVFAWRFGARWAIALAMAWGLSWIAIARLIDAPASTIVGLTAAVAAVVALCSPMLVRRASARRLP